MKTYSGNELIKVAKYRQSAQEGLMRRKDKKNLTELGFLALGLLVLFIIKGCLFNLQ